MNATPLALYLVASVAYAVHFGTRSPASGRLATVSLVVGALVHTFVIGMQTMQVGHVPLVGTTGAISAFVWVLALAYLYTEMTTDERAMGIFIVPLMVVLQLIPAITNSVAARPPVLESRWFEIHVFSLLVAYATFALACVISITYVLLFKELKAKHLGVFYARLPSLQVLDGMNSRAVTFGWVFLTLGLASRGDLADAGAAGRRRPARAGDVAPRSEDLHGAAVLAGVHLLAVRAAGVRLGRTPRGLAVGGGLRDPDAELRADRLLRHGQPQLLLRSNLRRERRSTACISSCSGRVTTAHRSTCESASTSPAGAFRKRW